MKTEKSNAVFSAGEKVTHAKFGEGFIRILKPFEKSFVEFLNGDSEDGESTRCIWVKNSELVKAD